MFGKLKPHRQKNQLTTERNDQVQLQPPALKHEKKQAKMQKKSEELSGSQFRILN